MTSSCSSLKASGSRKKLRDADQQVAEQRLHFVGRLLQVGHVVVDGFDLVHRHAPLHAALHGGGLVVREVVPRAGRAAARRPSSARLRHRSAAAGRAAGCARPWRHRPTSAPASRPAAVRSRRRRWRVPRAACRRIRSWPGDCTITRPPSPLIARTPCAPSLPVPESTMPIADSRRSCASERKKPSIGSRWPRAATGSSSCSTPLWICRSQRGGMT